MSKIVRRTIALVVFCLAVLPSLQGCDTVYRILQKEGAEEKEILGPVIPFQRNEKVEYVQKLLDLYGYHVGRPDGILGVNTRKAVVAFQEDNGLKVSRFIDKATWETLILFEKYGLVENADLNVSKVQAALKAAGLDPGPVDGKPGRKTKEAVVEFQKRKGLSPDGKIGYRTLTEMALYLTNSPTQK